MTCNKKTKKNKIPCKALYNKLEISDIPQELKSLNKLEIALIFQCLLFKKSLSWQKDKCLELEEQFVILWLMYKIYVILLPRNSFFRNNPSKILKK